MYVESLALENYRNYAHLSVNLSPGINIFFGDNAQGKTNVLEALYMCATTKSHRAAVIVKSFGLVKKKPIFGCCFQRSMYDTKIDVHLKEE